MKQRELVAFQFTLSLPLPSRLLKVMLHEKILNDDFYRNTALQHCCYIVSNGYNVVPTLLRYVVQKIVVANLPV